MREAAGVHLWMARDYSGAEGCYTVSWEELGSGGHPLSKRQTGIVGREVDAIAAVDLPVDEARDNVSGIIAVGIGGTPIARDDDVLWAAERGGGMLRQKMECAVICLTC
jgi:hypothetical protein